MGQVLGVRGTKKERQERTFAERLAAAHATAELADLRDAGASRRALNVWRQWRTGKSPKALAAQFRVTESAVRKLLGASSDLLRAHREAKLPEIPDALADFGGELGGRDYVTWVSACADAAIDYQLNEVSARTS